MMESRTLRNTDLAVSRFCLGTMTFGGQVDEAAARSMIDAALEHGINFVDTANVYKFGKSEEILGQALKGRRERVVVASKVGLKMSEAADDTGLSRAAIVKGVEDSLRRLQTDHLDVCYLHQPDYATPLEESLAALDELVRAGKVRYLGASNYASWQVCRLLWLAQQHGWQPVRVIQPMYNLLARGIEAELLPLCSQFGLTTVAYNPLAGGLLTGKHTPAAPASGSRFEQMPAYRDRYWHNANFQAVADLSEAGQAEGRSLVSLSLAWLLFHTPIDCVLVGASRLPQLQENLAALERGPLGPETLAVCERVWKHLRGPSPQYHR